MQLLRRRFIPWVTLCLVTLLGTVGTCAVAQTNFTKIVVFGDSLSDTGNIAHLTQSMYGIRYPSDIQTLGINYTDGRFTDGIDTQPAASKAYAGVWVEQLATLFGPTVTVKNSLDGGTDYAYGDATTGAGTTTESRTYLGQTLSLTLENMGQQVNDYLATNPTPNATTLCVLWGGSNDILNAAGAGTDPVVAAQVAVGNELALVQQLIAAGATNFLIPNVPPLGAVAAGSGAPAATVTALNNASYALAQGITAGLTALKQASMSTTLSFYQPDVFSLFSAIAMSPTAYAFGNLATPAQGVAGSPDTYLIWDGLHPTTTGHHFVAATAANLFSPLAVSTTALTVPAASLPGQTVTASATVTSAKGGNIPTGLVTVFDGKAVVGSGALGAAGTVQVTFTPTEAAGASVALTAVYAGDVINNASLPATGTVALLNAAVGTSTTVSSSATTANVGAAVTFTATVAPTVSTYGTPQGTVTFLDGTSTLGTGTLTQGTATFLTSSLAAGTHSITATYAANGVFGGSTSAAVSQIVAAPAIAPQASPASITIKSGASGTVNLMVGSVGGYSGTVTVSCGTLPAHLSCSFGQATIPVTANTPLSIADTLTIATNAAATTTAVLKPAPQPGSFSGQQILSATLLLPGTFGLMCFARRRRRSAGWLKLSILLLGCGLSLGLAGCGGGASNNAPAGSYTVPVVFTPASTTGTTVAAQTVNVTVIVQ